MSHWTARLLRSIAKRHKRETSDGRWHGIKQEADYDNPDKLYGMLIARIQKYHPSADVTQIEKAYNLAKKAHGRPKEESRENRILSTRSG